MEKIYLDNSATTRPCREALETDLEVAEQTFGNPSSLHSVGLDAERTLADARKTIAATVGDRRGGQIVFTASGTEANNLAILGRAHAKERFCRRRILTTAGEHASVGMPLAALAKEGFEIVEIPTRGGQLDLAALDAAADASVILATMMLVNNETGALYDLAAVSKILRARCPDAVLHCDATQAYLKIPISVASLGISMLTLSSHKIEGPKGVGALWVEPSLITAKGLSPHILGGGQEQGLRSGTENVPGIAAFARAAELGARELSERSRRLSALRAYFEKNLLNHPALAELKINRAERQAPHIISLTMPKMKSETLLHALSARGIYVSSGSACSSHGRHSTPALTAFGLSDRDADSTIRVSLSHRTTEAELDALLSALAELVPSLARMR